MSLDWLTRAKSRPETASRVSVHSPWVRRATPQAGQATVEFAFSISIFVFLLFGFIGLAIVFFSWLSVANAAREGARYVIANPSKPDEDVKTYICSTTVILGGSSTNCNNIRQGGSPTLIMTIEPAQSARITNAQVSVRVKYQVPVPTLGATFINGSSITFLGPIWVESVSAMRIE